MPKVYIGACEYEVRITKTQKETEKYLGKAKVKGDTRWVTRGKCFGDAKRIVVAHDIKSRQDRYEILLHEGIHAICMEYAENAALVDVGADEPAVAILSKSIASFLRQIKDNGVLDK